MQLHLSERKLFSKKEDIVFFLADRKFFTEMDTTGAHSAVSCFNDIRLSWTSARREFSFFSIIF